MKKQWKNTIKLIIVLSILFLPFIYITELISIEAFLDSFENPKHYMCIQSDRLISGVKSDDNNLIIIQKSSHPNFIVNEKDYIIYITDDGFIKYNKIDYIKLVGSQAIYYTKNNEKHQNLPIFKGQIFGKVIKTIDDNILNTITIKIWEASINNLNIRALTN